MDDEDVIRGQMEDTRTSLTDKLETLEQQVSGSVHEATINVADTVEAVKDSVQDTVASVKETVIAVKESISQGVSAVKGFFDITEHANRHSSGGRGICGRLSFELRGSGHAAEGKQ
jgi:hypothetical protein